MQEDLPSALTLIVESTDPNQDLVLFKDVFQFQGSSYRFDIEGEIYFRWLPEPRVRFRGINKSGKSILSASEQAFALADAKGQIDGSATVFEYRRDDEERIEGIVNGFLIGDITIPVNVVRFEIPNFKCFTGQTIQTQTGWMKGRLCFKDDETSITIDKLHNMETLYGKLRSQGGYCLLCTAELRNLQPMTGTTARTVLSRIGLFLSFLNGRRTLPVYATGSIDSRPVWKDYSFNQVAPYKDVDSWFVDRNQEEIDRLWSKFSKLHGDADAWDCLKTTVHWYLEANANSGYVEGSIVMTHNALELLYHWMILEERRLIVEDESTKISSVNKIRLLLNAIGVTENHDVFFVELKNYLEKEDMSSLELFVRLRNSIVHPSRKKREQLRRLPNNVRAQVLQIGLWYVEMSLLFMLSYNGNYSNRCSLTVDLVPWRQQDNDSSQKA